MTLEGNKDFWRFSFIEVKRQRDEDYIMSHRSHQSPRFLSIDLNEIAYGEKFYKIDDGVICNCVPQLHAVSKVSSLMQAWRCSS